MTHTQDATALADALEHLRTTIEAVEKCRDTRPLVFTLTHSDPISVGDLRVVYTAFLRAAPPPADAVRQALETDMRCKLSLLLDASHSGQRYGEAMRTFLESVAALSTPSVSAHPKAEAVVCSHPQATVWFYRDGDTFMRCPDCGLRWCEAEIAHPQPPAANVRITKESI